MYLLENGKGSKAEIEITLFLYNADFPLIHPLYDQISAISILFLGLLNYEVKEKRRSLSLLHKVELFEKLVSKDGSPLVISSADIEDCYVSLIKKMIPFASSPSFEKTFRSANLYRKTALKEITNTQKIRDTTTVWQKNLRVLLQSFKKIETTLFSRKNTQAIAEYNKTTTNIKALLL